MLVRRVTLAQFPGLGIGEPVTLGGAGDAVGPVESGVEPLRRVGSRHLMGQHVTEFVVEGFGIFLGLEIAVLPAPVSPAAGHPVEDLTGVSLRPGDGVALIVEDGVAVVVDQRDAGLAEILLNQHVDRDLRPVRGDDDVIHLEHQGSVGISNLRPPADELHSLVRTGSGVCETTAELHQESPNNLILQASTSRAAHLEQSAEPRNICLTQATIY